MCSGSALAFHPCQFLFRNPDLLNVVLSGGMSCGQYELIVKFTKQQLSDFLTENLPILNPYLPQKSRSFGFPKGVSDF